MGKAPLLYPFSRRRGLSFPEGTEGEEGGFLSMLHLPGSCILEGLGMQGIVGQAVSPTVPFGPSLLVFACVYVYLCECLLVLWISVFVCHFGQGVAGAGWRVAGRGSAVGGFK